MAAERRGAMGSFAARIIAWHRTHGRHELPWQATRDPYLIWVAEIMLQQTQVATVIPYYRRFLQRFPDIGTLAAARLDEVLSLWSGLGYYSRARNLHRAALSIVRERGGRFPKDFDAVASLPGIGRSTAAAICAFAFGGRRAILDGNVKRVLTRHFGIPGYPGESAVNAVLWRTAESLLPNKNVAVYTQGLMDLGAGVCTRRRPRCHLCPLVADCIAHDKGLVARLPTPRPKRALPHRQTRMLVLQHAGTVLLEKRPDAGIWSGLWCFPEATPGDDIGDLCLRRFGARIGKTESLPKLQHGFTHFRLSIEPLRIAVTKLDHHAAQPGHVWLSAMDAEAAALPAPVRRILTALETANYHNSTLPPRARIRSARA